MSEQIEVVIDTDGLKKELSAIISDKFSKLEERMTPKKEPQSLSEKKVSPPENFDYRPGVFEALKSFRASIHSDTFGQDFKVKTVEDIAVITEDEKGKASYSLKESFSEALVETIGTIATDNCCIPYIWADEIERTSVYPGSVFLGAWFVNWYTEIEGKPGDRVIVCRVAPATCVDLTCDEPTTTAAEISCGTITLEHDVCAYTICKNTMETMQVGVVGALNEGLGSCLAVCVDNYFFNVALTCDNAGTLSHTGAMTGSLIAEAMGSMQAGTYEPVKLIMHPVPYKSLMQDTQFVYANRWGNRDVITGGRVAQYLGVEINEVPKGTLIVNGGTYRSLLLAKGALAGALKHGITIESEYSPRFQKRWVLADIKYGGICLHPQGIYWIISVET